MFLTGLTIGDVDREFHVLPFMLSGVMVDPANQNSSLLNPANQVIVLDDITALTVPAVVTSQAATAQADQTTALAEDKQKKITALLTADALTSPAYDQFSLTPEDQAKISGANDALNTALASGDPAAVEAALKSRNTIVQSAVTKSNAGDQTPAAGRLHQYMTGKSQPITTTVTTQVGGPNGFTTTKPGVTFDSSTLMQTGPAHFITHPAPFVPKL